MRRASFILLTVVAVAAVVASLLIQRRDEATIRQNENALQQQREEIGRATAGNQHLSNGVVQAEQATTTNEDIADYGAELAELRSKIAGLRSQEIQLSNQQWNSRLSAGIHLLSIGNSNLLDHNTTIASTTGGGPRAENAKLNDARVLTSALKHYANEHQGQFPSSLDQVTGYLPPPLDSNSRFDADAPLSGTNDFEIVYQGTTNDLGNIPPRRVALIRERQPWLTPDGKWARAYGFADGGAETVVSDDNFQSWDALHVVPPPASP
jgi:hypothetical protein